MTRTSTITRRLLAAAALVSLAVTPLAASPLAGTPFAGTPFAVPVAAAEAPAASAVVAGPGSKGSIVKRIQKAVGATVDGRYGSKTKAKVKRWQKKHDLPQTGTVDTATWAKMRPYAPISASPTTGNDISWPQCPKGLGIPSRPTEGKPMPSKSTKFVILGLTNGPGFHPNPCLTKHVKWIKKHRVYAAPYAFTTYPTKSQLKKYGTAGPFKGTSATARLKNAGYAEAEFNVANMKKFGITSPFIWVDVEPSRAPAPWSKNRKHNKAVFDGVLAAYGAAGLKVGIYSSEYPWSSIIGKARYDLPEWRTVGPVSRKAALKKCKVRSVQGGKIVMAQWWHDDSSTNNSTDYDVLCPGFDTPISIERYFTDY